MSTSKIYVVLIFILCSISHFNCLDEIDLPIQESLQDAIVIEGSLVLGNPSRVRVSITRLFDFGAGSLQPVNVREVLLLDEQDQSVSLAIAGAGIYEAIILADSPLEVKTGGFYRLEVTTFDGRRVRTTAEPLIETPTAGQIELALIDKERIDERERQRNRNALQKFITKIQHNS